MMNISTFLFWVLQKLIKRYSFFIQVRNERFEKLDKTSCASYLFWTSRHFQIVQKLLYFFFVRSHSFATKDNLKKLDFCRSKLTFEPFKFRIRSSDATKNSPNLRTSSSNVCAAVPRSSTF